MPASVAWIYINIMIQFGPACKEKNCSRQIPKDIILNIVHKYE